MISITVTQQSANNRAKAVVADSPLASSQTETDTLATVSNTAVLTDTTSVTQTTLATPPESKQDESDNTVAWIGVGVGLVVGVIAWKLISDLKKKITLLANKVDKLTEENQLLNAHFNETNYSLTSLNTRLSKVESTTSYLQDFWYQNSISSKVSEYGNSSNERERISSPTTLIRYATSRMPDELGVLRFSERSMSEEPSEQKMFILELDPVSGTGTYKINPKAMNTILQDLDVFKNFVKPFSVTGNITGATVIDKVIGRIVKDGPYWVVEQPLEITLVK
ncbi:MAG: hypothetical protein K2H47_05890 [Muribaculaceae bacterium]|nr:hypothetical protein [Muribaculaceae bacterium]